MQIKSKEQLQQLPDGTRLVDAPFGSHGIKFLMEKRADGIQCLNEVNAELILWKDFDSVPHCYTISPKMRSLVVMVVDGKRVQGYYNGPTRVDGNKN